MSLNELVDSILSVEIADGLETTHLSESGTTAAEMLTRVTQTKGHPQSTGVQSGRPILVIQAHKDALTDNTSKATFPRVKLLPGALTKVPHPQVELYVAVKNRIPHPDDPLPATLSLLHTTVTALEELTSVSGLSHDPVDDSLLRQARMTRLALLNRISGHPGASGWMPRLIRFYRAAQDGFLDDLEERLADADRQLLQKAAQIINRTEYIMGDKFENIQNSPIITRSPNSNIGSIDRGPSGNQEESTLAGIRHLPTTDSPSSTWDVFISHASEDKEEVARPLAAALKEHGARVWLDELEMKIGDSLRRRIDQGIASSRFAVIVISKEFFAKGWTQYELDGIVTKSVANEQSILPIWHNVTHAEVMAQSPSLADKVARATASHTVAEIAAEIAQVITPTT